MTLAEISVRGIMQSRGALVAMVQGPDNKTYIVHQGDKLLDGTIKSVTPQGLIVIQEVNDPLSLVKQREVRKLLRSLEDARNDCDPVSRPVSNGRRGRRAAPRAGPAAGAPPAGSVRLKSVTSRVQGGVGRDTALGRGKKHCSA